MESLLSSFLFFEIVFFLSHLIFFIYLYKKVSLPFAFFHPVQISFFFIFITAYVPLKINFVFQHSYLLYEVPEIYFYQVFSHYVIAQVLSYFSISLLDGPRKPVSHSNEIICNLPISPTVFLMLNVIPAILLMFSFRVDLIALDFAQFSSNVKNNGNFWLLMLSLMIAILPAYHLLKEKRISRSFYIYCFLALLFVSFFGARYVILTFAISILYVLVFFLKFKFKNVLPLFVVATSFFVIISFFRSNTVLEDNQALFLLAYFIRNNDFLFNSALPLYLYDIGSYSFFMGKTWIVDAFKIFQPSYFFDKELSFFPSRFFYGSYASVDARTFNFGFFGRAFMDFGIIGFYILFIVFQLGYHFLLRVFREKKFRYLSSYLFAVLMFIKYPIFLLVGLNSHIISLVIIDCVFFLLPNALLNKKI